MQEKCECNGETEQKGGNSFGISHTYALSEAEVVIVYDLGLQVLLDELKLLVTFTVTRQEAPDVHHLLAHRGGQFGDGDDLHDVMHVPLCKQSQRSNQDPARETESSSQTARSPPGLYYWVRSAFFSVFPPGLSSCAVAPQESRADCWLKLFFLPGSSLKTKHRVLQKKTTNPSIFSVKCCCNSLMTSSFV